MKRFWDKIKVIYVGLPLIFLLWAVYYPFVTNLFYSNTELLDNRALKTKPQRFNAHFFQNFTDYYNDTFAGREKLIVKYIKLRQALHIDTGQYFYGQKGWMFYDSVKVNNGNTMLDYYASVFMNDNELKQLRVALETEKAFYEKAGAKYVLLITPNKENIYSEYMPERMQKMRQSDFSRMDAGAQYLEENSDVAVLNLKPVLLQAKSDSPYALYYKRDTHWNAIGGYIGFQALVEKLNQMGENVEIYPLTKEMIEQAGMVGQDMDPTSKDMSYNIMYRPDATYTKTQVVPQRIIVCDNISPLSSKTLLLMGDSFSGALVPFLAKTYKKVVVIPAGVKDLSFYQKMLDNYKPDIVVHELVERYFVRLVNLGKLYRGLSNGI